MVGNIHGSAHGGGGHVVAVHGSVVDVRFPPGHLPAIAEAVEIDREGERPLVVEVQLHLDAVTARAVVLAGTGLSRGTPARATGGPIRVPVGEAILGRVLDPLRRGRTANVGSVLPA